MKCRICKDKGKIEKAVIFIAHHNLALCKNCFIEWYERQLERTIKKQKMFTRKDKILVAVSGGKDSLALWYSLNELGYKADGIYINLGIDKGDYSLISHRKSEALSKRIKRNLYVIDIKEHFKGGIPELNNITKQPACSVCGLVKRYFINKTALEKGYSCVATGHNLDDEVATLVSNTLSWDTNALVRQAPVLPGKTGFSRRVKPLVGFTEKEDLLYCLQRGIDYIVEECPLSAGTSTIFYKRLFNEIEQRSPGSKLRFYSEKSSSTSPRKTCL